MKNRPLHENLDTSFVNLSALLRYLRRRQFIGNIRVELSGYEADIVLNKENQLNVREYDRIAGRIAEGEEALQRLLIRAREPGGIIHVFQQVAENEAVETKETQAAPIPKPTINIVEPKPEPQVKIAETVVTEVKKAVANGNGVAVKSVTNLNPIAVEIIPEKISVPIKLPNGNQPKIEIIKQPVIEKEEKTSKKTLPDFPFELSNNFENRAKKNQLSAEEWQQLLNLTGELLKTIDDCLMKAELDFSAAFKKAGAEVSADYPFLSPKKEIFVYKNGKIGMSEQTNAKIFAAGINETLRRILDKLGASPKFAELHRYTTHKIIALIHQRKPLYDRFSITPQLEKLLGI
ncbi:MAG TPA: hypothetical protein PKY59_01320 [Pyrinomonadaceae bacterium]|nr:hypothetical protein [Pyrinomonadaceae bacterium]